MTHLTRDEMAAYAAGTLPEGQAARIEEHVAHCERCAEEVRMNLIVRERFGDMWDTWTGRRHGHENLLARVDAMILNSVDSVKSVNRIRWRTPGEPPLPSHALTNTAEQPANVLPCELSPAVIRQTSAPCDLVPEADGEVVANEIAAESFRGLGEGGSGVGARPDDVSELINSWPAMAHDALAIARGNEVKPDVFNIIPWAGEPARQLIAPHAESLTSAGGSQAGLGGLGSLQ